MATPMTPRGAPSDLTLYRREQLAPGVPGDHLPGYVTCVHLQQWSVSREPSAMRPPFPFLGRQMIEPSAAVKDGTPMGSCLRPSRTSFSLTYPS